MNGLLGQGIHRDILVDTRAKEDTAATVAIGSVSEQDWYVSRTHGVYHIPACAKGEAYALLLLTSRGDALDLGDNRRFPFTISAREIAVDLLQDLQDHGVFVCAGARPAPEELRAAIGLGVEREWAYVPMRMNDCPACGEKVKQGVAVCKHCGAILDAEKAAQHGLGLGAKNSAGQAAPGARAKSNASASGQK